MASNKISDILVQFVTAPPDCRYERDLRMILPIIMMKAPCLKGLRTDIVVQLLQRASHRICHDDDIIVKQGEIGEDFFIIIRGSTSVYIDPKLENEDEDVPFQKGKSAGRKKDKAEVKKSGSKKEKDSPQMLNGENKEKGKKDDEEPNIKENMEEGTKEEEEDTDTLTMGKRDKKDYLYRKKFGNLVNTLGRYESFGELALLYSSKRRMASVIADEDTDLLVVTHDLFNTTLRESQEKDQEEKKMFVRTHPFFSKWALPLQKQLQWSLRRSDYRIGTQCIKQGEPIKGLHFLASGRARLAAEPYKYRQQFPSLFGDPTGKHKNQDLLREDTTISELVTFKKQAKGGRYLANMEPLSYIRRSDGYVAVEKIQFDKMIDLCFIEEGEVICDSELLLGLEYNLFNVICSSACTFYTLNTRMFDRLIFKKNSYTLNMMKILTETKLSRRLATSQGKRIQILSPLLFHILNVRVVDPYASEKLQDGGNRLQANQRLDRSETVLVDWFMKGKTPLLQPITKNAIYYRELIQKRARLRKIARIRGPQKTEEYRSLQRRIRDAYHSNFKETLKAQTTMKNLSMRRTEVTQVSRWK